VLLAVFVVMGWQKAHSCKRHQHFYHDFIDAKIFIEKNANVNVCSNNAKDKAEFFYNTEITGNLERYYHVRLWDNNNSKSEYYLTTTASLSGCQADAKRYEYIGPQEASYYLLYKLKN